jgi:hypothetical protein
MVAGLDPTGRLLGDRRLDKHGTAGIGFGRAFHRYA